jgi:hypothetical protein
VSNISISKEWESFGSKETVFSQHLEALDKSQEYLARMIALRDTGRIKELSDTEVEFITFFTKSLLKSRIKINKYNSESDELFRKQLDNMLGHILNGEFSDIKRVAFVEVLYKIGLLYDKLGYNSPERLKTKTPIQSDLEISGMETDEYVESLSSGYIED